MRWYVQFLRWIKRTSYSAIGKPYLDVRVSATSKEVELDIDYNAAFVRHLDELGYSDYATPGDKVDAYIAALMLNVNEEEPINGEGPPSDQFVE